MDKQDLQLIEQLLPENEELASLWREHRELETQLDALGQRVYLSPAEQAEAKRLKKVKLAGRDRIEEILAAHRQGRPADL
jgi:hypothetical protein